MARAVAWGARRPGFDANSFPRPRTLKPWLLAHTSIFPLTGSNHFDRCEGLCCHLWMSWHPNYWGSSSPNGRVNGAPWVTGPVQHLARCVWPLLVLSFTLLIFIWPSFLPLNANFLYKRHQFSNFLTIIVACWQGSSILLQGPHQRGSYLYWCLLIFCVILRFVWENLNWKWQINLSSKVTNVY